MFQRPTSITVIAVVGIIIGAFGLICSPLQALGMILPEDPQANEMIESMGIPAPEYSPTARVLLLVSALISIVGAVLLLSGSIGSFWMKNWARLTMNSYAILALVNGLFNVVVQMIFVLPGMMSQMPQFANNNSGAYGAGAQFSGILGALLGFACMSIYPVLVLVFYNRVATREAFALGGIVPVTGFPPPAAAPMAGYHAPYGAPGYMPSAQPGYPPAYGGQPYTPPPPPPGYGAPRGSNARPHDPGPLPPPDQPPAPPGSQPPPPPQT
ncbi:hypothetical protein IT571_05675 [Candidatus Sumerlaeota bacterium]|nr:hypothetical protein [Candidatus Sumerlaeota bacterium]